ncbi:four helix bundle protein [Patescibacteria group bacterium]
MSTKIYNLEERTTVFSENIIKICKKAEKNYITKPLINQLIRSGISIGANYFEANGASSKKDFRNKIFICKKETKETMYWLRLLIKSDNVNTSEYKRLSNEASELVKIFSKIAYKLKN